MEEQARIFEPNSRVVAYVRDSGGNLQVESTEQQLNKIGEWCKSNGLILTRTFRDEARSGTTVAGRDAFLQMMRYLDENAKEKGLVLWELSRFARDYDDSQYFLADLRRRGFIIHSITDGIPTNNIDGRVIESLKIWQAAKYSIDLGKNVRRGQQFMMVAHHGWRWKPPPGYKLEAVNIGKLRNGADRIIHTLVVDHATAPLIRDIFRMRLEGATMREIHNRTHIEKYMKSYKDLLTNPIYIGVFQHGDLYIPDYCEPIIDADLFAKVQKQIAERSNMKGVNHPRVLRSRFFLSGLLRCERCGGMMFGTSSRPKEYPYSYDYYRCPGSQNMTTACNGVCVKKDWIEGRIMELVKERILKPDVMADLYQTNIAQAKERAELGNIEAENIRKELTGLGEKIGRVVATIRDIGHSPALTKELSELEKHQLELQAKLDSIDTGANIMPALEFGQLVNSMGAALDHATEQEKGIILRGVIKSITVNKNRAKISGRVEYRIPIDVDSQSYFIDL